MARLDVRHWLAASGDTWQSIADAVGVTRAVLLTANGNPTGGPKVGQVYHLPLAGTP